MPWSYRMSYTEDFLLRQSIQVVKTLFVIDRIKHRSYSKNWPPPSFDCNCEDDVWFVWLRVLFPAREELEEHAGDHESNKVQINEAEKAEVGEGEGLGVVVSSIASLRLGMLLIMIMKERMVERVWLSVQLKACCSLAKFHPLTEWLVVSS